MHTHRYANTHRRVHTQICTAHTHTHRQTCTAHTHTQTCTRTDMHRTQQQTNNTTTSHRQTCTHRHTHTFYTHLRPMLNINLQTSIGSSLRRQSTENLTGNKPH